MTRLLAALALALSAGWAAAADPKLPDVKAYDKSVIDGLREVHNKGAELYNTSGDYAGAYRLYQGALESVRPLLAHRPEAQKIIDAGLAAAAKETEIDRKAFVLHETIESVRKQLKVANGLENPPAKKSSDNLPEKKPEEKKPVEKKPVIKPEDKKPVEKKPEEKKPVVKPEEKKPVTNPPAKKPEEKKPTVDKKDTAPMPKAKGGEGGSLGGSVTVAGKPLAAGEVTLVSVNLAVPKVFTAEVKNGAFKFASLPAGRYAALVTGEGVPAKYHAVNTSGLTLEVANSAATTDLNLK